MGDEAYTEVGPPWLEAKIEQRIALIEEALPTDLRADHQILVTFLVEPDGDTPEAFARAENTCDLCGLFVQDDTRFFAGQAVRKMRNGQPVVFVFGVCEEHSWA